MIKPFLFIASALAVLGLAHGPAFAADASKPAAATSASAKPTQAEVARADKERRKPLRRCDQLSDKAQLDCLQQARERIVEARQKREGAAQAKRK